MPVAYLVRYGNGEAGEECGEERLCWWGEGKRRTGRRGLTGLMSTR